ncbi:MAG: hypothetical protein ABIG39_06165 [Candidatus Micrarchaeota archaeon]
MLNIYLKNPQRVDRVRANKRPSATERLLLIMVRKTAEASGKDFSSLLASLERRIRGGRAVETGDILPTTLMKPEGEIVSSCKSELATLSELYDVIESARVDNIKELRATGKLKKEEYSKYTQDQKILREWFIQQEKRAIGNYSEQLSRSGTYEVDNKYASYRVRKIMMWDVDDTLTPTNVPSMFDGMLKPIQDKCDEGFMLATATGKPVKYVKALFDDPYGTGTLIERVKKAISPITDQDTEDIKRLISQGHAGLLSDLDMLDECDGDLHRFLGKLETRRESEWLPEDIHSICESGCHVRFPDGKEYLTVMDGDRIDFIPFDASVSETSNALQHLSEVKHHLDSIFNGNGTLFINAAPGNIAITNLESQEHLPHEIMRRVSELSEAAESYFDLLINGGVIYGEAVEARKRNEEHLMELKQKASENGKLVVIVDHTYRVAKEILERNGNFEELKQKISENGIGVTSDIALIEAHEKTGDPERLMTLFKDREVMVIPKPSESFYDQNEVMFCPRPATYVDGDQITAIEQFIVRALNSAVNSFIEEKGAELDCVSANHGLDITPKGISKPVALRALNQTISGHKLIIYAGDSGNDVGIMSLKGDGQFQTSTNSSVIPVAVFFKEQDSGGVRKVSPDIIRISDAHVKSLEDISTYQELVEKKIKELRSEHETVRKVH